MISTYFLLRECNNKYYSFSMNTSQLFAVEFEKLLELVNAFNKNIFAIFVP